MSEGEFNSAPPWASAALHCIGWIPTADGHLSFSLIGEGTSPVCDRYSAMIPNGDKAKAIRKVGLFQERRNIDIPWLFRVFSGEARHHWLLVGEAKPASYYTDPGEPHKILDQQGMLRGQIIFVPYQSNNDKPRQAGHSDTPDRDNDQIGKLDLEERSERIRSQIATTLRPSRKADDAVAFEELEGEVKQLLDGLLTATAIEFALFRTGELRLWLTADEIAKLESTDDYPKDDNYAGLDEIPNSHSLLRQAYYFVKDAVHQHVHHDGQSDQIVPPVFYPYEPPSDEGEQASVCEQRWHRETLWGLSRAIDELVRKGSRETLRNALGFICFAESFQTTLSGHVRRNGYFNQFVAISNFHQYDFKSLRESVRTALDRKSWNLAIKTAMVSSVFAVALSSLIATNAVANHPQPSEPSMWSGPLAQWLYHYPAAFPVACAATITLLFLWVYSEEPFLRRLFYFAHSWNRLGRAHVRYALTNYNWRGKSYFALLLITIFYLVPIALLGGAAWRIYGYIVS